MLEVMSKYLRNCVIDVVCVSLVTQHCVVFWFAECRISFLGFSGVHIFQSY